ncbi:SPA1-related 3 isoform 3 [Quillaja saponaria]|uniref:SPA1-related 3 isoform 3 n=1 Tax=Quillaja saponaria TaxID=32244 RepID=A0AAD7QHP2_QUISA|nr:SPA1-related 3 isoform 3 [Quillaja saponaria]
MERSSGSGWQNSESSRALRSSGVSDRNPWPPYSNRVALPGEGLRCSTFTNEIERVQLVQGDQPTNLGGFFGGCAEELAADPFIRTVEWDDVSLRQWLEKPERSVDPFQCLHIFRQVVEIVNVSHSQGIVVHNVRPSCFVMSSFNHVSFIESASCSDSGSDSFEDGQTVETKNPLSTLPHNMHQQISLGSEDLAPVRTSTTALSETSCMQSSSVCAAYESLVAETKENITRDRRNVEQVEEKKQSFPMKEILLLETSWYTSPEEVAGAPSSCASDIYRLGVLLFELFCPLISREEKTRTMSSLRHRVLPPQLLLKWPKEASFCLWLLHPESSSRPTLGELLQSEFLNEQKDDMEEREAAIELRESPCSELGNDDSASSLPTTTVVDSDDSACFGTRKRVRPRLHINNIEECDDNLDGGQKNHGSVLTKSDRLMKNFKKLESAYYLTRCRPINLSGKQMVRHSPIAIEGRGSTVVTERSSVDNLASKEKYSENRSGWINPFLEGLCKYLSFGKLKVKADLKQGDLLNSSNLVCSVSFDRDGEFFATAGVNKKIKVFECDTTMNEDCDIHYPVVEMASRSKLSSICWNTYIKSQIASSNFEGVVQIWDVARSQVLLEMREHERRVWSVDFSSADPTMLASGSDDGSVKLWSINQRASTGTIKTKAYVCCVQFPPDSGRSIAFGSADHRIYYYDLRNSKTPLCTLIGHSKTVSYVKFVDTMNLVSASTDNTLKLWDLSMCASRVIDTPTQSFTGHMNVKNFVGLSVSDGYIATGSETNEVFIYHKAFPMPALSFKFNNTDPLSGSEMDDASQFISSVSWRGQSSTLVAANSTGNIKILEMV